MVSTAACAAVAFRNAVLRASVEYDGPGYVENGASIRKVSSSLYGPTAYYIPGRLSGVRHPIGTIHGLDSVLVPLAR